MKQARLSPVARRQRGAATLVVVMVLFLVMALLAAYANRSLMFEQRIAGSYYRASMSQEMAEAGVEWTVAMLNGTGIDATCTPVATGGTRFVDLYLNVSADDRATTPKVTGTIAGGSRANLAADCASNGTSLVCRCPQPNTRTAQPATVLSGALIPSLGAAVGTDSVLHYGSFLVDGYGCTDSSIDNCATADSETRSLNTTATTLQKTSVAFIGAVPSSPAAPLIVKGSLTTSGAGGLGLHNTDPRSAGLLVVSGGNPPVLNDDRMDSVPGTPPDQARIFGDSKLLEWQGQDADGNIRFFRNFMGMAPSSYPKHPAARLVTCGSAADCGTDLVNAFNAGKRLLTIDTAMGISGNVTIGTVAAPVLIVVNGNVNIDGPMQLNGMLVVLGKLTWTNNTPTASQITGMVLVQGDMDANGRMDIVYQQSIANELRNRLGSYVRVPGGWIDGAY